MKMSEGKNIMIPEQKQLDNWFDKLIFEEKVKMLFGDCLLKIREIPDNSVDLIVTDPPYGINLSKGYKSGSEELVKGDDGFTIMVFVDELMKDFSRILKPNSAMYIFTRFDVYPYWWLKIKNYFETKNQIIWSKGGGGVGDLQGNYIHNYESIIYATNGKHKLRNKREGSVWQIPKCKLEFHETEKPVELIEKIILKSSDEGMVVFDPFMGSGTTGIACIKTKRQFIGIEMIEKNYQTAKKRVWDFYKSFSHGTLFYTMLPAVLCLILN